MRTGWYWDRPYIGEVAEWLPDGTVLHAIQNDQGLGGGWIACTSDKPIEQTVMALCPTERAVEGVPWCPACLLIVSLYPMAKDAPKPDLSVLDG